MADTISISVDVSKLASLGNRLHNVQTEMPKALAEAVSKVGPIAASQMKRVLPGQTGLNFGTINRALKGNSSGAVYVIRSRGGDIRLKFFNPRETAKGVTAAPWNSRRLYPGTFIRAGWWPMRKQPVRGGHVFERVGRAKYPIKAIRSGLLIPEEMLKGNSAAVFYGTVEAQLMPVIDAIVFKSL